MSNNKNATIKTEDPEQFFTLQEKLGEGYVVDFNSISIIQKD